MSYTIDITRTKVSNWHCSSNETVRNKIVKHCLHTDLYEELDVIDIFNPNKPKNTRYKNITNLCVDDCRLFEIAGSFENSIFQDCLFKPTPEVKCTHAKFTGKMNNVVFNSCEFDGLYISDMEFLNVRFLNCIFKNMIMVHNFAIDGVIIQHSGYDTNIEVELLLNPKLWINKYKQV